MQQPFKKLKLHEPSLPAVTTTAKPEQSKVVSNPTRLPINRQAALVVRQTRCWLEDPLPEKPKTVPYEQYARSQADLKIERNSHAATRDELGKARGEVKALEGVIAHKQTVIEEFARECRSLKDTIKQLEELKL